MDNQISYNIFTRMSAQHVHREMLREMEPLDRKLRWKGRFVLVLGIAGLFIGPFGVLAVWYADTWIGQMRSYEVNTRASRNMIVGLWLGITSICIAAIGVFSSLVWLIVRN